MTKVCPRCAATASADAARCACGHEWPGEGTHHPEGGEGDPETPLRRLARDGLQFGVGALKFRLFGLLLLALLVAVLACGVGFLEARDPIVRTLFGIGFLLSFGGAAFGIVWLREKLT
jgi:Uncharacterised protein family UPF0547